MQSNQMQSNFYSWRFDVI